MSRTHRHATGSAASSRSRITCRTASLSIPVCGDAFFAPGVDPNAGYNFMSVLSHDHAGPRRALPPTRTNVCGFSSQTWNDNPALPRALGPADRLAHRDDDRGSANLHLEHLEGPALSTTRRTSVLDHAVRPPRGRLGRALTFARLRRRRRSATRTRSTTRTATPIIDTGIRQHQAQPRQPDDGDALHGPLAARRPRHVIYAEWGRLAATSDPVAGGHRRAVPRLHRRGLPGRRRHHRDPHHQRQSAADDGHGSGQRPAERQHLDLLHGHATLSYSWTLNSTNPVLYTITNPIRGPDHAEHGQPRRGQDGDRDPHSSPEAGSAPARRGRSRTRRPAARCGGTWAP